MDNKKRLIELLDFLKKSTTLTADRDISVALGYNKSYISVCLSNNNISDKLIDKIEMVFAKELAAAGYKAHTNEANEADAPYSIRRKPTNDKIVIRDGMARMYESQQRMEARQMVMRNFLAEIYAKTFEQPVTKVLDEMGDLEKKAAARLNGE